MTLDAILPERLFFIATQTFNGSHIKSINGMSFLYVRIVIVFCIVMTNATREEFHAFGALFVTTSLIVWARIG